MPILGIMASAMSANLWQPEGAYDSLATVTLSAATSSVTFAGIPSTYKHLQLRTLVQQASTGGSVEVILSNATFVRRHYVYGDGASAAASADTTNAPGIFSSAFSNGNSVFAGSVIDILDYTSTNKNKVMRSLGGVDNNGSGSIFLLSSLYTSSTAITSMTLNAISQNFTANSTFALYGVK